MKIGIICMGLSMVDNSMSAYQQSTHSDTDLKTHMSHYTKS